MADEEVRLTASMNDDLSSALQRIENRLNEVERQLVETAAAGKALGRAVDDGAGDAEEALKDLGKEADRTTEKVKRTGDETARAGNRAGGAGAGFDRLGTKLRKTRRQAAGFASILTAFKIGGLVTAAFALAGGVSAVGAGAAVAVGGLMPMLGVLALIPPLFLAAKLAAWTFKLAAEQLSGPLTRIKDQFGALGQQIADGGLAQGLDHLASSMFGLSRATGTGLAGIGGIIGDGATALGDWIKSPPFLEQVSRIFLGLNPIIAAVVGGLLVLGPALLGFLEASLPAVQMLVDSFRDAAAGFAWWLDIQNRSGRTTRFLLNAWALFARVIGVLVDVVISVYNVLRIAAGYAVEFGLGIEDAAWRLRQWTRSAEGQARINEYFREALPAIREMGRLLGMAVAGFASLAANQDIAPLLSQIRTELAPAFGALVANLSGEGGLGPALITATAAVLRFLAGLDFSGLTAFIVAVGQLATGVAWISQNVPGANFLISALLASMLGFKLLGPVFAIVGGGAKAFSWVWGAAQGVSNLSRAQQVLKGAMWAVGMGLGALGTAFKTMAIAGIGALRALSVALFTTPVGWIILAIMAVIAAVILLWNNCAWFRDAVTAAWEWIKNAAVVSWEWIVSAVSASIDWIVAFVSGLVDGVVAAWRWVADAASATWSAIVGFVQGAIDVVSAIVMWLWTNVISPVWTVISTGAQIAWAVIMFAVQTAVFVIVGIITLIALVAKHVWDSVGALISFVFDNVIMPVIEFFRSTWETVSNWVSEKWTWLTTVMAAAWDIFYTSYIKPVIDTFKSAWEAVSNWVSEKWTWLTTAMSEAWDLFYGTYIEPVINFITEKWDYLTKWAALTWQIFTDGISEKWNGFQDIVGGVIDWISERWDGFTTWLGEVFGPIGDAIGGFWEGIQKAASAAADIVKSAWDTVVDAIKSVWNWTARTWNGIPSITVPDFVPGMGGETFSLPKLPMLWKGGETPGGPALVGEHGAEPLVRGGRVVDMLGMNGPEVRNLPKGGYVVPNLRTLAGMPGLAKSLPSSVAAAVAASVPGYAPVARGGDSGELLAAVRELTAAVRGQRPSVTVTGGDDVEARVASALRTLRREDEVRRIYGYEGGRG